MPLVYYQIRSNLLHFCYVYSVPAHVCEDSCLYPPIEHQLHAMYSLLEPECFASSYSVCVEPAMAWTSNIHIILSEQPEQFSLIWSRSQ